ncbi:MAG: TatD family hydrolase [Candidatus Thorarchaeota archaeon]|nr:MAG: TatD family hydrolase [Candidatus Thorarchaeota archaeon]
MLVDMHFHIDSKWHNPELVGKTLADIEKNRMLVAANSTDISSYFETLEISKRSDFVFPAFGILPWYAHEHYEKLDEIEIPLNEVGMLGEIGIDYKHSPAEAEPHMQKALFEFFLAAAEKHDLILNNHVRGDETFKDARDILGSYNLKRVIMHSHYEQPEGMRELADRGYYFTVGQGFVEYRDDEASNRIKNAVREIPNDALLVEVDTIPREGWVPPSSKLKSLLDNLAEFRGVSIEELEDIVHRNSLRLLRGVEQIEQYVKLLESGV